MKLFFLLDDDDNADSIWEFFYNVRRLEASLIHAQIQMQTQKNELTRDENFLLNRDFLLFYSHWITIASCWTK